MGCGCRRGFTLLANKKTCGKITKHPCDTKNGGCNHICKKRGRSAVCACRAGYTLIGKKTCVKVKKHPCEIRNGGCAHICRRQGKQAVCLCRRGYTLAANKKSCTKVGYIYKLFRQKKKLQKCSKWLQKMGRTP